MGWYEELQFLLRLSRSHGIVRRYFVVNGFDGALTMLGIIAGFYQGEQVTTGVVIAACMGAAVALGVSGLTSAYISESAEQERQLQALREAMITDLNDSAHARSVRLAPFLVAGANGLSPFLMALIIMTPLFISHAGWSAWSNPLEASIAVALVLIFLLGVFLGRVSNTFWLWSGLRTMLVAVVTGALVFLLA